MEKFKEHVFISYAHLDNLPGLDEKGWVTRFNEIFSDYLAARLGTIPTIWRDEGKLQGNSALTPEIEQGLANSALLVTILSPSYIISAWCLKELRDFCELANQSGGLLVDNMSRVLKVVKLPPESLEILPDPLRDVLDYRFYSERAGGYEDQLDPGDDRSQFKAAITRLAADAERLIKQLRAASTSAGAAQGSDTDDSTAKATQPICVYLAECTADLREMRERLAADLKQSGCLVLPDRPLPTLEQTEFCAAVRQACQECDIAIHLIGSRYGAMPETAEPQPRSVVELQNQIAAELAGQAGKGHGLRRLIWLSGQLQPSDDLQRSFVERLDQQANLQVGADLIRGDFEELRTTLHRLIKARREALAAPASPPAGAEQNEAILQEASGKPMVYLVCTMEDLQQTRDLRKWLRQQGCDVERPLFEGDAKALGSANQELMQRCSAVIHFYGAGTDRWLRSVRSELRKINIYRQGQPPIPRVLYVADPDSALKQDQLDDPDDDYTLVIDGRQPDFDPTPLAPLIQVLHAGGQPDA
ncbi:MAG: TIR domain-containing protein [Cyanobium sp.]